VSPSAVEGVAGSPGEARSRHRALDPGRFDAGIVALFDHQSEGWELLCVLPDEVLAQLHERQRRRELDASALVELRLRYRHLLSDRRRKSWPGRSRTQRSMWPQKVQESVDAQPHRKL
jgi:hypothetical protein